MKFHSTLHFQLSRLAWLCLAFTCLPMGTQLWAQCPPNGQTILYVDAAMGASGDGFAWGTAFKTLQEALDATTACPAVNQIWVKKGTYYPTSTGGCGDCFADIRFNTFKLKNGVSIYGGFGGGETMLAARNIPANPTVLSGDIGVAGDATDNAFHVINSYNVTATLDGLTITDGNASQNFFNNNVYNSYGGGLYSSGSTLTINHCNFVNNQAISAAGGLFISYTSTVTANGCVFTGNHGADGGAMYVSDHTNFTATNCIYTANYATNQGGAIATGFGVNTTIANCTFHENYLTDLNATDGGAIFNDNTNTLNIYNSIFNNNRIGSFSCPGYNTDYTLTGADIKNMGVLNVQYSATQTTIAGTGNFTSPNTEPWFANSGDPAGEDHIFGTADDGLRLKQCSDARNAGSNALVPNGTATDFLNSTRITETTVDMGAYETPFTAFTNIIYVNGAATGLNNGTTWQNAFTSLQAAIEAAICGGKQIWVAKGTYYPSAIPGGCRECGTDPRKYAFKVYGGTAIYGGFIGTENTLAERDIVANPTILSGNIGALGDSLDNCYHVVVAEGKADIFPLDGFTITGGQADFYGSSYINNNIFYSLDGGGIYSSGVVQMFVQNCTLTGNFAGSNGGAVSNQNSLGLYLNKCNVVGNSAGFIAGAINNNAARLVVNECVFEANHAPKTGAIINSNAGEITANNTIFSGNHSVRDGGVFFTKNSSITKLNSCTFYNNYSEADASITAGAFWYGDGGAGAGEITNCIFYNNRINSNSATPNYTEPNADINPDANLVIKNTMRQTQASTCATCVQGFNVDPLFANAANVAGPDGLYRTADDGLQPQVGSPAINTGTNSGVASLPADIAGASRIQDAFTDLGAYEHAAFCGATTKLFVDSSKAASGNGTSWANAYKTLQEAIAVASNCSSVTDIWLAKGTYYPTAAPYGCSDCGSDARKYTFRLKGGWNLYGGFAGTETTLAERVPHANNTILSGDIGVRGDSTDNCYHVVLGLHTGGFALDGLTVSDGLANQSNSTTVDGTDIAGHVGAGLYQDVASTTLTNCLFTNNHAQEGGGAVSAIYGGMFITGSSFTNNSSGTFGGAINNQNSPITAYSSTFTNNSAYGAGVLRYTGNFGSALFVNCVINNNHADYYAGAVWADNHSETRFTNCTIYGNYIEQSGPNGAGAYYNGSQNNSIIQNTLFYKNSVGGFNNYFSANSDILVSATAFSSTIFNSSLQAAHTCTDCLPGYNTNPKFADEAHPAGADNIMATADDGFKLLFGSQAINTGSDPAYGNLDITGGPRKVGNIDIGAYETNQACPGYTRAYVDSSVAVSGTGASWASPFKTLQEAINVSTSCAELREIWVKRGTYFPTEYPAGCSNCNSNYHYSFLLRGNLAVYGGFNGSETEIADRDIMFNATILSGVVGKYGADDVLTNHVLITLDNNNETILNGFTITKGSAGGPPLAISGTTVSSSDGGGMININKNFLTIGNCIFKDNRAAANSGAIHNLASSPILTRCQFINNSVDNGYGGVSRNDGASNMVLDYCVFSGNHSVYGGTVANLNNSLLTVNNSLFEGNFAGGAAGGLWSSYDSYLNVTNCTFYNNYTNYTGGGHAGAIAIAANNAGAVIANCIFSKNGFEGEKNNQTLAGADILNESSSLALSYSALQSAITCSNCLPVQNGAIFFMDENTPAGNNGIFGDNDDGLALSYASPVINKGNNAALYSGYDRDLTGNYRIQNTTIDMGCYEKPLCYTNNTLYVDNTRTVSGQGYYWHDALKTLDEALGTAKNCPAVEQVWVKKGTYYPSVMPFDCINCGTDARNYTFTVRDGLALYGGFAGGENTLAERDLLANTTVLSGDIGVPNDNSDNSLHVMYTYGNHTNTIIDGFTIRDGNANKNVPSNYSVQTPSDNIFGMMGGGMYHGSNYNLNITSCTFTNNRAVDGAGMYNAACYLHMSKTNFTNNIASHDAGALYGYVLYSADITNCAFYNNTAGSGVGGAIEAYVNSHINLYSCVLAKNSAQYKGGATIAWYDSNINSFNCTYHANYVVQNELASGGAIYTNASFEKIHNCIFTENSYNGVGNGAIYNAPGSDITYNPSMNVQNCLPQTSFACTNCLPSFANPYYVNANSPAGPDQRFGTADDGLALQSCSPLISSGNSGLVPLDHTTDIAGRYRIQGFAVEMGAYEFPGADNGNPGAGDYLAIDQDVSAVNVQPAVDNEFFASASPCRLMLWLRPSGGNDVTGQVYAKTGIDASVQFGNSGNPYVQRHFEILPDNNATTATARITLFFTQKEFDNFNDEADFDQWLPKYPTDDANKAHLKVYQYHGESTDGSGTPDSYNGGLVTIDPDDATEIVWNTQWLRWEVTINVEGFSGFFVGADGLTLLPVQLISFTGQLSNDSKQTDLQWKVAEQKGIKEYVVERAIDGGKFTAIGSVTANSHTNATYPYTDKQLPVSGELQYRLKIVGVDGKTSYSKIVSFTIRNAAITTLYPVPAKDVVYLKGSNSSLIGTDALLIDLQGRTLQHIRITAWPQRINTANLANGVYFVKTADDKTLKMVIEH